ncbi:MAG: N-acetylglucosamine-6-phosphate deacetylase [Lachnospiraceae bacterium]|jgi:N-acetylglucosamine-6-phosphate deacetylase
MIIKNGWVFDENGTFTKKDLYIANGKIVGSLEEVTDGEVIDASNLKVIPGLVDIHSHGAYGHDFSQADTQGIQKILCYEKQNGITSYCPTSMSLPFGKLQAIFKTALEAQNTRDGARILGIHMEGPFLSMEKRGAHEAGYLIPPADDVWHAFQTAAEGLIRLVTIAPETAGAMEFIDRYHEQVHISLGHTGAGYEMAKEAFQRGADHVTHLYNAMIPMGHREPGMVLAAVEAEHSMVELISDGVHVHPAVVRNTFRMFGRDRVVLISDSMMAAGMEDGMYQLGGQKVKVADQKAMLEDGTIAGSAVNLFTCMLRAMAFGVPEEDALLAATKNPAKSIGMDDLVGVLAPGRYADILLVDDTYQIKKIIA